MPGTTIGDDERRSMRQKAPRPSGLGRDRAVCVVALTSRIFSIRLLPRASHPAPSRSEQMDTLFFPRP
jgi:hypothetical protein